MLPSRRSSTLNEGGDIEMEGGNSFVAKSEAI
jgi:hypothetical protein